MPPKLVILIPLTTQRLAEKLNIKEHGRSGFCFFEYCYSFRSMSGPESVYGGIFKWFLKKNKILALKFLLPNFITDKFLAAELQTSMKIGVYSGNTD